MHCSKHVGCVLCTHYVNVNGARQWDLLPHSCMFLASPPPLCTCLHTQSRVLKYVCRILHYTFSLELWKYRSPCKCKVISILIYMRTKQSFLDQSFQLPKSRHSKYVIFGRLLVGFPIPLDSSSFPSYCLLSSLEMESSGVIACFRCTYVQLTVCTTLYKEIWSKGVRSPQIMNMFKKCGSSETPKIHIKGDSRGEDGRQTQLQISACSIFVRQDAKIEA